MQGSISRALAGLILPFINPHVSAYILSYFSHFTSFLSYFFPGIIFRGVISSHFYLAIVSVAILGIRIANKATGDSHDTDSEVYVQDLGGNGPRIAAYLRQSKKGESDLSMESQEDRLNEMIEKLKPSRIYWFKDPGMSSKSAKAFDKLRMKDILKLREEKKIDEFWAVRVDRMGRFSRRTVRFYLEFSEEGGIIRTPEKTFTEDDLNEFQREADISQKANEMRAKAVRDAKERSFKLKRWNKGGANKKPPIGYQKSAINQKIWLQKLPNYEPLIKKIYVLFINGESFASIARNIGTFNGLLDKPLTPTQVERILSDPLYMGKPRHMGATVIDPALAFVDEGTYQKSIQILSKRREKRKSKKVLEKIVNEKPSLLQQLFSNSEFEIRHTRCGGKIWMNGPIYDEGIEQQILRCSRGDGYWRFPHKKAGKSELQTMGGLNYDTGQKQKFKSNHENRDAGISTPDATTSNKNEQTKLRANNAEKNKTLDDFQLGENRKAPD
jgi:DNA invertase Pin-like site-specific DNA recombinase